MKKKSVILLISALMLGMLSSCGGSLKETTENTDAIENVQQESDSSVKEEKEDKKSFVETLKEDISDAVEDIGEEEADIPEDPEDFYDLSPVLGWVVRSGEVTIDNITYNLYKTYHRAMVSWVEGDSYEIPTSIEYDSETYDVVGLDKIKFIKRPYTIGEIPSHIKYINEGAFQYCQNKEIVIPDTVEYMFMSHTFDESEVESVVFPEGFFERNEKIMAHWDGVFKGCKNLTSFTVPEGVKVIEDCTFGENLAEIKLPSTLEKLDVDAFWGNKCLTELDFPEGLREITIKDLPEQLKTLEIKSGIKYVCIQISENEALLEELAISDKAEYELYSAYFYGAPELKRIVLAGIDESNSTYYYFGKLPKLEYVEFPDNITEIKTEWFKDLECEQTVTLVVPNDLVEKVSQDFSDMNVVGK